MRVASLLYVEPPTVEFDAFDFDHEYVATVLLRNASDRTLRFRVTPPPAPASPFRVLHQGSDLATSSNPTMVLPPGLRVRLEVTFTPPPRPATDAERRSVEHAHIYDAFQLAAEDGSAVDVPLVARRAFPQLEVAPTWCDLGLVVLSHRAAALVQIRNVSTTHSGRFDLEVLAPSSVDNGRAAAVASDKRTRPQATANDGGNQLSVTPQRGLLAPGEECSVKVELLAQEIGSFRAAVRVRIRERGDGDDGDERTRTLRT
ncbi:hypothetical protein PINS_up011688 [Pythium insidiosum]|nr:hypothetical protein PINS_up011688 [Pythium insidiosum]